MTVEIKQEIHTSQKLLKENKLVKWKEQREKVDKMIQKRKKNF